MCKEMCNQKHLTRRDNLFAMHAFITASAVKQTERTTKKKQFHVMMKNLFTSSSGSDSMSCGISKMHFRRGER